MDKMALIGLAMFVATGASGAALYIAGQKRVQSQPAFNNNRGQAEQNLAKTEVKQEEVKESTAKGKSAQSNSSSSVSVTSKSTSTTTVNGRSSTTTAPVNIAVSIDSTGSGNHTYTVAKGAEVNLRLTVSGSGLLHFTSSDAKVNPGAIAGGSSKTLIFKAEHPVTLRSSSGHTISINAD